MSSRNFAFEKVELLINKKKIEFLKSQNRFHRKSSREVFNRAEFFLIEFLVLDIAFPGFFRIGERYDRI